MRAISCGLDWQLFLDNHVLARSTGFQRVICPPRERGVVIPADRPWETQAAQSGLVGRRDDGSFYAFYRAMWWDPAVANSLPGSMKLDRPHWSKNSWAYAVSDDGLHWIKPDLGLASAPARNMYDGALPHPEGTTRENNIGVPFAGIHDLGLYGNVSDPDKKYVLTLRGDSREAAGQSPVPGHAAGTSCFAGQIPDFLNDPDWREKLTPINGSLSPRGDSLHYWDAQHEEWVAIVQCIYPNWLPSRDIARYATRDFNRWTAESVIYPDAEDGSAQEAFEEPMFLNVYWSEGVLIGLMTWFTGDRLHPEGGPRTDLLPERNPPWPWYRKGLEDVRLVISRDGGKTWNRSLSRKPWIPGSPDPHAYNRIIHVPKPPVRVGDEDWFYVTVADGDHLAFRNQPDQGSYYQDRVVKQQIALYTQKHNRFVCMRASTHEPRVLITKPLLLTGDQIELNVDASHGRVRVAVAMAEEQMIAWDDMVPMSAYAPHLAKPVDGFEFEDCVPIRSNSTEYKVDFRGGGLEVFAGKPVYLMFEITDADLFGFRSYKEEIT